MISLAPITSLCVTVRLGARRRVCPGRAAPPGVHRYRRGFTLLEILAVIGVIGVLAAIASPTLIYILRDRDIARSTMRVGDIYRFARGRALERQAVLVSWSAVGGPSGKPGLTIREAIVTQAGAQTPTCTGTNWVNGNAQNRLLSSFPSTPEGAGANPWGDAVAQLYDPAGVAKTYADICYTARGRTFVRYSAADPFTTLTGVPRIDVTNGQTGYRRVVFIPPSTVARIAL